MNRPFVQDIVQSARMLLVLTVITGVVYPLGFTGLARVVFPYRSGGSLMTVQGRVVGSELIGQQFTAPGYFWGRLSATGPVPYNAGASTGSNYGPLNPALAQAATDRASALRKAGQAPDRIPVDLLTASGSGLDPHISPAGAYAQVARVAAARGLDTARVRALVDAHTEGRTLGVLGEPRVNVLLLNLELDRIGGRR